MAYSLELVLFPPLLIMESYTVTWFHATSFVINNFFCDFFLCFVSIYMYIYKYTLSVGQYHVKQNSVRMPVVGVKWQDL